MHPCTLPWLDVIINTYFLRLFFTLNSWGTYLRHSLHYKWHFCLPLHNYCPWVGNCQSFMAVDCQLLSMLVNCCLFLSNAVFTFPLPFTLVNSQFLSINVYFCFIWFHLYRLVSTFIWFHIV
jgi:hypothetical protein